MRRKFWLMVEREGIGSIRESREKIGWMNRVYNVGGVY